VKRRVPWVALENCKVFIYTETYFNKHILLEVVGEDTSEDSLSSIGCLNRRIDLRRDVGVVVAGYYACPEQWLLVFLLIQFGLL